MGWDIECLRVVDCYDIKKLLIEKFLLSFARSCISEDRSLLNRDGYGSNRENNVGSN